MKQLVLIGAHGTSGQLGHSLHLKWIHLHDLGVSLLVLAGLSPMFGELVAESGLQGVTAGLPPMLSALFGRLFMWF